MKHALITLFVSLFVIPTAMAQDDDETVNVQEIGEYGCSVTWDVDGEVLNLSCVEDDSPLNTTYDFQILNLKRRSWFISEADSLQFEFKNLRLDPDDWNYSLYVDVLFYQEGGYEAHCEALISNIPRRGGGSRGIRDSAYVRHRSPVE